MEDANYIQAYNRLQKNISEYQFFYVLALFLVISLLYLLFNYTYSFREFDKSKELNTIKDEEEDLRPDLKDLKLFSENETDFDNNINHYVLADYIVASSYNSCLVQNQRNDYLSDEILKKILNLGARFLTFQIARESISEGAEPVVASVDKGEDEEVEGNWITSLNTLKLPRVLNVINLNGFNYNAKPINYPLFLFFELRTNDPKTLDKMARHIKDKLSTKLLPNTKYGEGDGKIPLSFEKLINLKNKIIILVDREDFINDTELEDIVIKKDAYLPNHFLTPDQVKEMDNLDTNLNTELEYARDDLESRNLFNMLFPEHNIDKIKRDDQCRYGECELNDDQTECNVDSNKLTCNQLSVNKKVKISCEKLNTIDITPNYSVSNCRPEAGEDFESYQIPKLSYQTYQDPDGNNPFVNPVVTFMTKLKSIQGIHNYLSNYNKFGLSIVKPFDNTVTYTYNYDFTDVMGYGCQFICMNYQVVDPYLKSYLNMFKEYNTSFLLKPHDLRIKRYLIPDIDLSQVGYVLPTENNPINPKVNFHYYKKMIAIKSSIGNLYLTISSNLNNIFFSQKVSQKLSKYQLFNFIPSTNDPECFYIQPVIDNTIYLVLQNDIIIPKRLNERTQINNQAQFYSLNEPDIIQQNQQDNHTLVFGFKNPEDKYSYIMFSTINLNNSYGLKITNRFHNRREEKIDHKLKLKFKIETQTDYDYIIYLKNYQGNYLRFNKNTNQIRFENDNNNKNDQNKFILKPVTEDKSSSDIIKLVGQYYLECYNEISKQFEAVHVSSNNNLVLRSTQNSNKLIFQFIKKSPTSAEIKATSSQGRYQNHLLFSNRTEAILKDINLINRQGNNIRNTQARFDIQISISHFN